MPKYIHEVRDPIHVFVRMDSYERAVLNSRPFQRLRHIHQLALTYLVYPGATHKRFEHSLGVMELAGRVFDIVTHVDNVSDEIRARLEPIGHETPLNYWRLALRMAALCHDIGHLPFSHAAEQRLLPEGWDHERLTRQLICCDEMQNIWNDMTPPLRTEDVVKRGLRSEEGKRSLILPTGNYSIRDNRWRRPFGVDRIRLSSARHLTTPAWAMADSYRLIDTLRILPARPAIGRVDVVWPRARSISWCVEEDAASINHAEASGRSKKAPRCSRAILCTLKYTFIRLEESTIFTLWIFSKSGWMADNSLRISRST